MALSSLSLIFNLARALKKQPQIASIKIDTFLSEDHSYSSSVTTSPIEDGAFVNDHIIKDPFTLSVNGYVSNIATIGIGVVDQVVAVAGIPSALKGKNKAKDAEAELVRIRNDKEIFTVVTGLRSYKNMVITNVSFPRSSTTGSGLEFNATFQQIEIAKIVIVQLDPDDEETVQSTIEKGKQDLKDKNSVSGLGTKLGKDFTDGAAKAGAKEELAEFFKLKP
ncbi:MAG TPA: hypothetical protein ENI23_03665 [bacterium]|nr:hypothetical protein [bacterium]